MRYRGFSGRNSRAKSVFNPYKSAFDAWMDTSYRFSASELDALRERAVEMFAYGIPDQAAIDVISESDRVIEVGANTGYWAWLLEQNGCDVLAVDKHPADPTFTTVKNRDHTAIRNHSDRALLVCWAALKFGWARECVEWYHDQGGDTIYVVMDIVRERSDYPDSYVAYCHEHYELARTIDIPSWPQVDDSLFVFKKPG